MQTSVWCSFCVECAAINALCFVCRSVNIHYHHRQIPIHFSLNAGLRLLLNLRVDRFFSRSNAIKRGRLYRQSSYLQHKSPFNFPIQNHHSTEKSSIFREDSRLARDSPGHHTQASRTCSEKHTIKQNTSKTGVGGLMFMRVFHRSRYSFHFGNSVFDWSSGAAHTPSCIFR